MNTNIPRNFRPRLHFSPPANWINDPNGLLHDGEKWHAFAQYNPHSPIEGMHWCHMISDDLVTWDNLPVALVPDELGQIFSGSAIVDIHNTSGFGNDAIIAMFTHHGAYEQQSIAYSTDGINFIKYHANPVIPNTQIQDFRDPKVFYNPIKKCWSAAIAAGDRVVFYCSHNMIEWEKTGEFTSDSKMFDGVWECPDMLRMKTPDGAEKWVLIVSFGQKAEYLGSKAVYFIGEFDGDTFIQDSAIPPRWLDYGFDNYAAVSFFNAPNDEIITLGWELNWQYCNYPPTDGYEGILTLPRRIELCGSDEALALTQRPYISVEDYFGDEYKDASTQAVPLNTDVFKISAIANADFEICIANTQGENLKIGLCGDEVYVDRCGSSAFLDKYEHRDYFTKSVAKRHTSGTCKVDIYFDVCSCEVFVDCGRIAMANLVYTQSPFTTITADGCNSAKVYFTN